MHKTNVIFLMTSIYYLMMVSAADDHATHHKNNTIPSSSSSQPMCRDRLGYFRPDDFRVSTCSMCFVYLFPTFPHFRQFVVNGTAILVRVTSEEIEVMPVVQSLDPLPIHGRSKSGTTRKFFRDDDVKPGRSLKREDHSMDREKEPRLVILRPDVNRKDSMEDICLSLTSSQCQRWRQCCQAASQCCDRQMKLAKTSKISNTPSRDMSNTNDRVVNGDPDTSHDVTSCPVTWDGYSCVQETLAGKTAHVTCPSYISLYTLSSSAIATRRCLHNATWWKSPVSHLEWTDYSGCIPVDFESIKVSQYLAITCNCISIICLAPSLVVFIIIRPLRRQPRIQLHISLFIAMLLSAIFGLLWERLVMYDMLVTPLLHNFVHSHPNACRFLNMSARLSDTFTFFWMFCQGFHLHWLMVRSFKPVNALITFSLVGWGIPILLITTYITVRYFHFNDDPCWIQSSGSFEWIIDGPTMACIAMNLLFLVIILRALWSQLGAHPDHIGPVRRTVRALFLLIPLFGLQQFCIIYRPHVTDANYVVYDVISAIIVNSQGAVVAIMFCFLNEEVQTHVRHHVIRCCAKVKAPLQSRQRDPASGAQIPMAPVHRPSIISTVLP